MKLSKTSEYSIRLICWLAANPQDKFIPLSKIAEHLDISFYQLTKVAQPLIRGGLINSYTGPNGGVELGRADDGNSRSLSVKTTSDDGQSVVAVGALTGETRHIHSGRRTDSGVFDQGPVVPLACSNAELSAR